MYWRKMKKVTISFLIEDDEATETRSYEMSEEMAKDLRDMFHKLALRAVQYERDN